MKPASRILLLLFAAALTLAAACSRSAFDAQVERAETLMDSAPGSAMAIAEALQPTGRAEKARAALLLTKARYKAYIPLTNDSLISIAATYYSGRNDSLETQALFLLGETYYEKGEYGRALLAALKAERKAVINQSWFNAGRTHRLIAQIYAENFSFSNEYKHRIKASDFFTKASKREYALWEKLDAAMAVASSHNPENAKILLNAIAEDTIDMPDNFKGRFHRYSAVVSILASEYEAVINQMNDARKFNGCYSSHDYSTLARAYSHLGKPDEATLYIDSAKATASSFSDQGNIYIALSELADRNDKDEANKYLRLYLQLIEPKMDSIIASPIENLTIDFYNDEIKQENAIRAKYNTIMILSITILVLILIFLSHRLYKRKISIHLQKERIQQLVLELEAIKDAQKEFSLGKNDFYQTLESNLKTIELIGEQYFRDSKSSYPSENTSKIKEIIDSFGSDSMISKLEKVINENHPGLIDEVKANYPKMSGKQKMLLYYSILGLSSEAICAIVSIKEMNALYALRSRLRKTLASNPSSSYDLLVSFLKIAK